MEKDRARFVSFFSKKEGSVNKFQPTESGYNKTEITSLIQLLPFPIRSLILTLFSLLQRLLANSTSSGLTPPALASLFGPLLFGLGASASSYSPSLGGAGGPARAVQNAADRGAD